MSTTKDDILLKLLKKAEADVPCSDFTDTIMEQLQGNVAKSLAEDGSLSYLIDKTVIDRPSLDFTDGIISKLKPKRTPITYKPLISKRVSFVFAVTLLVLVVLSFITNDNSQSFTPNSSSFDVINKTINTLLQSFTQETTLVILCLISLSVLLCIDFVYRKKYL